MTRASRRHMGPSRQDHHLAPHAALVVVQILFGTWPIFGKIALRGVSSYTLVGFRICGAAIIFAILQKRLADLRRVPKAVLAWLLLTCLLGVVLNQMLFVKGISLTTVVNAALLTTTIPVVTLIISIILGHDRATIRNVLGIGLAAAGVIYLIDPFRASLSAENNLGNLLVIGSSFCYGAYIAASRDLVTRYGALNVITWIFAMAALVSLPVSIYAWWQQDWQSVSTGLWISVIYIVLVPTVGAYYLNAWALSRIKPSVVAVYVYLQPLLAFGLGPLVLGEHLSPRLLVACLLIFAGVAVVTVGSRSRAIEHVSEQPDALAR